MKPNIALVAGPYVGKSTLAKHLRDRYGYSIADHSRTLIGQYVRWYNRHYHTDLTVDVVYQNKPYHREALIWYGTMVDYNRDTNAIDYTLLGLSDPIVFDSARSLEQVVYLHSQDYLTILLSIDYNLRVARAAQQGCDESQLKAALEKEAANDLTVSVQYVDYVIDASGTPEHIAQTILALQERIC